jgi:hypothetical protein
MLYVQAIRDRKQAESGGKDDGVPQSVINLMNVVSQVKQERREQRSENRDQRTEIREQRSEEDDISLYDELLT